MKQVTVVPDAYFDSVFLMSVAGELRERAGVNAGMIVLGTDANREALTQLGFDAAAVGSAGAHDLLIAVDAEDAARAAGATEHARELLRRSHSSLDGSGHEPRSLPAAIHAREGANLALISVPGEFAAREAATALHAGLHAMVFSDNVSLADEIALKEMAHERGLLMMGPDCGTALINGVPLGFANVIARGSIGMVGASGTGMQEVMCLIDRFGGGISQAIGIGGRDLSAEVGGTMAIDAIGALAADARDRGHHARCQAVGSRGCRTHPGAPRGEREARGRRSARRACRSGSGNRAGCRRPLPRGAAGCRGRGCPSPRAGVPGPAHGGRRGLLGGAQAAAPLSARSVRRRDPGCGSARHRGPAGGARVRRARPHRCEPAARRPLSFAGAHHRRSGRRPVHARPAASHDRPDRSPRPAAAGGGRPGGGGVPARLRCWATAVTKTPPAAAPPRSGRCAARRPVRRSSPRSPGPMPTRRTAHDSAPCWRAWAAR